MDVVHAAASAEVGSCSSGRLEQNLDRIEGVRDLDRGVPLVQPVGIGHDALRGDEAAFQEIDGDRVTIGAEMGPADVEFLAIADDRPVDRGLLAEDRELDEAAELADEVEALRDADRGAGSPRYRRRSRNLR